MSGNFEPEGMDVFNLTGSDELAVGMGKYGTLSQYVRFTIPYTLTS